MSVLSTKNIGKIYNNKRVVRDVNIEVKSGQVVGLLGPNGAGKTTSFYIMTGLVKPDYGSVILDGVDITQLPIYQRARAGIGYLPQESSIFRGLNVEDNILAILELCNYRQDEILARLESLLSDFSITHLRSVPSVSLSGGERRRLEVARCIASNPRFVLLDEPLSGVDPIAVYEIRELILGLKKIGIGVLITDHNVRETLGMIDKAYIMHDGGVIASGTPAQIIKNKEVKEVYLGDRFTL